MDNNMLFGNVAMKAKILVLFANQYEMNEGGHMEGTSVHYLFWGENGEALLSQSEWDVNKPVGVQRAKVSLAKSMRQKLVIAPAIYEGSFEMKVGGDGKPVMKLIDVAYVSNVEIKSKVVNGLVVPGMVDPADRKDNK